MSSSNRLREIEALGQSVWLDNLNRQLLDDGELARLIEEMGSRGSRPTRRSSRRASATPNVQRPLWASTSTKNPDYPGTLYVDELIGPDTVNTMPDQTLAAARDHATPARTVDRDLEGAHRTMDVVRKAGVDVDDVVLHQLVDEGVQAFSDAYESLLETLEDKARELAPAS